jgi:aspartyl-tRNA(Asn)/glutamyl-tRNA(Gln) amidotransferase subunit A
MASERLARRLALLQGLKLSQADLESITAELELFDGALQKLEAFSKGVAWPSLPVQPYYVAEMTTELRPGSREQGTGRATEEKAALSTDQGERTEKTTKEVTLGGAELCELGLVDLAQQIKSRAVSSTEAVEAALERLDKLNPQLNVFITVGDAQARKAARQADEELARRVYRGPLHGVPVSVKDLFFTAGLRTTGGSRILAEWVPDEDSALVERLKAAGAVILGKTNLDEFGHGGTSTVSHFGPVHNPWNLERIAGGSSGGSSAAVAAGIGPLSYGTETGSSVRRPSAYCGVAGFKPTFGIVSRHGSFRGAWSMDHAGVFARSVPDLAIGLDAIAGYDPRDPASVRRSESSSASQLNSVIRGVRIGVLRRFLEEGVEPAVLRAFEAAIQTLRAGGAQIIDVDIPELNYAAMTSMLTSAAESAGNNLRWMRERPEEYQVETKRRLASGMAITASEFLTVQRARYRIREALREAFASVDLLANPTTNRVAPLVSLGARANGDQTYKLGHTHSSLLRFPSMLGLPGCSIPCGANEEGLPIGMQLVGRWFADQRVLNVAFAYQRATQWAARKPRFQ